MVKLYVFMENSPYFVPVYPAPQSNSATDTIRIWKINYPKGIKDYQDFLLTEFPDSVLYKAMK